MREIFVDVLLLEMGRCPERWRLTCCLCSLRPPRVSHDLLKRANFDVKPCGSKLPLLPVASSSFFLSEGADLKFRSRFIGNGGSVGKGLSRDTVWAAVGLGTRVATEERRSCWPFASKLRGELAVDEGPGKLIFLGSRKVVLLLRGGGTASDAMRVRGGGTTSGFCGIGCRGRSGGSS
jgi:hypothetical protein